MTTPGPLMSHQVFPLLKQYYLEVLVNEGHVWTLGAPNANYVLSSETEGLFQIRGQWRGTTADEVLFTRLRHLISECNSTQAFPKAYLWPLRRRGHYGLMAEGSLLITHPPTETQFFYFMDTVLTAIAHFFREADRRFPELATWGSAP